MQFIGRKINVGLGKETERGTSVVPTFWIPRIDFDFDDKFESVVNESSLGVIEDAENQEITKKWGEGSLGGKIRDDSFGLLLLATFGEVSSALHGGEAEVYDHDFLILQSNQHPSLTLSVKDPQDSLSFPLAVVNSLEIALELGSFIRYTVSFFSKRGTPVVHTPAYTVENEFLPKHAVVKIADNLAGLEGAPALKIRSLTLTIEKNIESDDILGAIEPVDFLNKQLVISGSMEVIYEDTSLKTIALEGTKKALGIELVNSDVTIGLATNPTLEFKLAKVKATEWTKTTGLDEIVRQTFGFKGFFSLADAKSITAKLINKTSSY